VTCTLLQNTTGIDSIQANIGPLAVRPMVLLTTAAAAPSDTFSVECDADFPNGEADVIQLVVISVDTLVGP
jgi:hypothetical protein